MAARTASRRCALTFGEFCRTSDTSDFETPARAATVRMVGGRPATDSDPTPTRTGCPQVGDQDTDGLGPNIGQRARRQVHPVAELRSGLLDPAPLEPGGALAVQ